MPMGMPMGVPLARPDACYPPTAYPPIDTPTKEKPPYLYLLACMLAFCSLLQIFFGDRPMWAVSSDRAGAARRKQTVHKDNIACSSALKQHRREIVP